MQRNHPLVFEAMKINHSPIVIPDTDIQKYNQDGWDIYWCWNYCEPRRGKENLKVIYSFYVDIDVPRGSNRKLEKMKIQEKIRKSPLVPSTLIETYNGYQLYWDLDRPIVVTDPVAQADWFKQFVVTRLIPFFGGDRQAADAVRLLRAPFTRYWGLKPEKAPPPDEVSEIRLHWGNEVEYSLEELERAFPEIKTQEREMPYQKQKLNGEPYRASSDQIEDSKSQQEWLSIMSGSEALRGEVVTFRNEHGVTRIYCNGRRTNSWIDKQGKIGSTDNGGPTIAQFIGWYGYSLDQARDFLRRAVSGTPNP